ncbi:hypothetical protein D3C73_957820 [compost metagenome]
MGRIRTLIIGIVLGVCSALFFGLFINWDMAMKLTGGVGLGSWLLAGILSGAFISGDRTRANNSIESAEDKKFRNKYSIILFIFGLPFLIVAMTVYLIT